MKVARLDHLVLTVASVDETIAFYSRVLGMTPITFGGGRSALVFGDQKINLHPAGGEFEPKARRPTPGSADLCFVVERPIQAVLQHLGDVGVTLEQGPVARTGAVGAITSAYVRDPDGNLVEIATYDTSPH